LTTEPAFNQSACPERTIPPTRPQIPSQLSSLTAKRCATSPSTATPGDPFQTTMSLRCCARSAPPALGLQRNSGQHVRLAYPVAPAGPAAGVASALYDPWNDVRRVRTSVPYIGLRASGIVAAGKSELAAAVQSTGLIFAPPQRCDRCGQGSPTSSEHNRTGHRDSTRVDVIRAGMRSPKACSVSVQRHERRRWVRAAPFCRQRRAGSSRRRPTNSHALEPGCLTAVDPAVAQRASGPRAMAPERSGASCGPTPGLAGSGELSPKLGSTTMLRLARNPGESDASGTPCATDVP